MTVRVSYEDIGDEVFISGHIGYLSLISHFDKVIDVGVICGDHIMPIAIWQMHLFARSHIITCNLYYTSIRCYVFCSSNKIMFLYFFNNLV